MSYRLKPFYNDIRDFHNGVYDPESLDEREIRERKREAFINEVDSQWESILMLDLEKLTGR